ncbi:MAG: recombinase family protein [Anaerovoracaceae bacterium]
MKRVALYMRVSTEEQALHGYSLPAQKDALHQYAKDHNMTVVGEYVDEGISGRKSASKRPALARMLRDVEAGKIDQILFIKLDRWFRSVKEYYRVQEVLDRNKVTWRTILEDYNTESADGILKVNIMLSVAQNEAERTGERIKFVLDNKAQKKQVVGKQPYGYKIAIVEGEKKSVIDEETAPVVHDIFNTFDRTNSASLTTKYINEKHGTDFSAVFIRRLLHRSAYAGEYMGISGYRPQYISRERFDKNQEIFRGSHIKRTPTGRVYIFTGILFCVHCGHRMKGKYTTVKYYCCPRATDDYSCENHKHISELKIEKYLVSHIRRLMSEYIVAAETKESATKRSDAASEVMSLRQKIERLNDIYLEGNMDKETYRRRTEQLKQNLAQAEEQYQRSQPKNISHLKEILNTDFLADYDLLTDENKRSLWRRIITRIEMNDQQNLKVFFS